ncbi:MAG: response regulator [Deltaproteobacteria bacterium]|nr:MAG: response regulator [Deltaproteobacteria bacterium]
MTAEEAEAAASKERGIVMRTLGNLSILLVEDNPDHAMLTKLALSRLDEVFEVRIARDGLEAMEMLRGGYRPDLALIDLRLPRLDGVGLIQAIRSELALSRLPIAVLSTSTDPRDVERSVRAGADLYLDKPLVPSRLREVLPRA